MDERAEARETTGKIRNQPIDTGTGGVMSPTECPFFLSDCI